MHEPEREPVHISVPGRPDDPRNPREDPPGVIIHYVPDLHPDDVTVVDGIPVTSVARTLIDCAEDATPDDLRAMFDRAHELGILDLHALDASLARVEWRPSLPLVRQVLAEFRKDPADARRPGWPGGGLRWPRPASRPGARG